MLSTVVGNVTSLFFEALPNQKSTFLEKNCLTTEINLNMLRKKQFANCLGNFSKNDKATLNSCTSASTFC